MAELTLGFALCGSFCTYRRVLEQLEALHEKYPDIIPILSEASDTIDSRFGTAEEHKARIREICGRPPLTTLAQVEPFGPKGLLDLLVIAPCTGNTLGKLAAGIADSPVTLACKAHLRNQRPVVIAVSTNDALAANASNLGILLARKNFYFVPFGQDDPMGKPCSLVADFTKLPETVAATLEGRQIQPILL